MTGSSRRNRPQIHALLIGIDCYLPWRLEAEGVAYPSLRGCVHDVLGMRDFLRRAGVPKERIEMWTSTLSWDGEEPDEPRERWPTYENLTAALERRVEQAAPEQHILIHYSGHGGRCQTSWEEKRRSGALLDEALAPLDVGAHRRARYLRDWELGSYIQRMAQRGAFVTLLLDSCHSGGMLRTGEEGDRPQPRGTGVVDPTVRPAPAVRPVEGLAVESSQGSSAGIALRSSGRSVHGLWCPVERGFALLAACSPHQQAMEASFRGGPRGGALTYHLLDALAEGGEKLSYREMHHRLLGPIHARFPGQTPLVEGEVDRLFLGLEKVPTLNGATVVVGQEGELLLETGSIHAVGEGARFQIYSAGLRREDQLAEAALATVEIDHPGVVQSRARVVGQSTAGGKRKVRTGDRAVLLSPGGMTLRRRVTLLPGPGKEAFRLREMVDGLEAAGSGFLQWIPLEALEALEASDGGWGRGDGFTVALVPRRGFQLGDASGRRLPDTPILEEPTEVVQHLEHLARFRNVEELRNGEWGNPLRERFRVEASNPAEEADASADRSAGLWRLQQGDDLHLKVTNDSEATLNVAILDLQPGWSIEQVWPPPTLGMAFQPLDPGEHFTAEISLYLPRPFERPVDLFKILATTEAVDFRGLELPVLGQKRRFLRCRASGGDFQSFLEGMAVEAPRFRVAHAPSGCLWTVLDVAVQIEGEGTIPRQDDETTPLPPPP